MDGKKFFLIILNKNKKVFLDSMEILGVKHGFFLLPLVFILDVKLVLFRMVLDLLH